MAAPRISSPTLTTQENTVHAWKGFQQQVEHYTKASQTINYRFKEIFHPHSAVSGRETQTALSAPHEDGGAEEEGNSEELMKNLKGHNV